MNKTTLISKLRDLANRAISSDKACSQVQLDLEQVVQALLEQESQDEVAVLSAMFDNLNDEAAGLLLDQLELQSELVHLDDGGQHSAVLIALPVCFLAGDNFRHLASSTDDMLALAECLQAAGIVDPDAQLQLLPRLFTHEELADQGYGARRRLTRSLGEKVLDAEPARVEPGILDPVAPEESVHIGAGGVVLRYLVGVVVTRKEDLHCIFQDFDPSLVEDQLQELEQALQDGCLDIEHMELTEGGQVLLELHESLEWEQDFRELVEHTFGSMFGCYAVTEPASLSEALRFGQEFRRDVSLSQCIESQFVDDEPVRLVAQAFSHEGRYGWELTLVDSEGRDRDCALWDVLAHEDPDESAAVLEDLCRDMGWQLEGLTPVLTL